MPFSDCLAQSEAEAKFRNIYFTEDIGLPAAFDLTKRAIIDSNEIQSAALEYQPRRWRSSWLINEAAFPKGRGPFKCSYIICHHECICPCAGVRSPESYVSWGVKGRPRRKFLAPDEQRFPWNGAPFLLRRLLFNASGRWANLRKTRWTSHQLSTPSNDESYRSLPRSYLESSLNLSEDLPKADETGLYAKHPASFGHPSHSLTTAKEQSILWERFLNLPCPFSVPTYLQSTAATSKEPSHLKDFTLIFILVAQKWALQQEHHLNNEPPTRSLRSTLP